MLTEEILAAAAASARLEPSTVIVKALDAGAREVALHPERTYYPASTLKTPLAVVAYDRIAAGELALDDRFEVTQANMTTNGQPSPLVPGYRSTVRELIELMITISDNVATNMFYDILGRDRATEIIQTTYGLTETTFRRKLSGSDPLISDPDWVPANGRNAHSPKDAARILEMIAREQVPFAAKLFAALGRQKLNGKINPGLRPGDRFYHKGGTTDEVLHDCGILDTAEGKRYVLVVFTGLQGGSEKNGAFEPFMKAVRPLL